MEELKIEVYSRATNSAIVRMPGRKFPGLVIQGDTLNIMLGLAESIADRIQDSEDEELVEETKELNELLVGYLQHYAEVLEEHEFELPYVAK